MPLTTAYANGVPELTGVVTCKVDYPDGTSANIHYPVELFGLNVVGRWGTGKDVKYDGFGSASSPNKFTLYLYAMTDPNNPDTFEQLYSETGKLDVKVDKKGNIKMDGKSFAVLDFNWGPPAYIRDALGAECDWKLEGTVPII
jgi:hypothetical protein